MEVSEWTQYFQPTMWGDLGACLEEIRCGLACSRPFKVRCSPLKRGSCVILVIPVLGLHIDLNQLENEATPWITQHRSRLSFFLSFSLYLAWCLVEVRHTRQTLDYKEGDHKLTFSLNNGIGRLLHISHLFHLISLYIFSSSWEAGASVREENAGVCQ